MRHSAWMILMEQLLSVTSYSDEIIGNEIRVQNISNIFYTSFAWVFRSPQSRNATESEICLSYLIFVVRSHIMNYLVYKLLGILSISNAWYSHIAYRLGDYFLFNGFLVISRYSLQYNQCHNKPKWSHHLQFPSITVYEPKKSVYLISFSMHWNYDRYKQSINQSINQSISQSVSQSGNQPDNHSSLICHHQSW